MQGQYVFNHYAPSTEGYKSLSPQKYIFLLVPNFEYLSFTVDWRMCSLTQGSCFLHSSPGFSLHIENPVLRRWGGEGCCKTTNSLEVNPGPILHLQNLCGNLRVSVNIYWEWITERDVKSCVQMLNFWNQIYLHIHRFWHF